MLHEDEIGIHDADERAFGDDLGESYAGEEASSTPGTGRIGEGRGREGNNQACMRSS